MQLIEPILRPWTRDEYHQLAEAGYFEGQRVELIEGEIRQKCRQSEPHAACILLVLDVLRSIFAHGFTVRVQMPLDLGEYTELEPDLAVVLGSPRDYRDNPTTALLAVEVSLSSLAYDRQRKSGHYARAGIAEFWIVDLARRRLIVLRDPAADPSSPAGYAYRSEQVLGENDSFAPLAAPQAQIAVADMLP